MKFICGSCNELIQDIHTSRYSGGAIPHEACGSITTFEPTDHPHTPKAIDVRPYIPKANAESQLAAAQKGLIEPLEKFYLSESVPFRSQAFCSSCETGDVVVYDMADFVHKVECESGEGLADFARAVRHAISMGLTGEEAIELVKAEDAEKVLQDAKKSEGNDAAPNAGESNTVVSEPDTSQAAAGSEEKAPQDAAKPKSSKKSQGK